MSFFCVTFSPIVDWIGDSERNSRKQIAVYEIFPLEAQPTINEIALLGIDSTAPTIAPRLAGNWVVFLEGRIVKVWDFVNDLWAEWNTQKDFFNVSPTVPDICCVAHILCLARISSRCQILC